MSHSLYKDHWSFRWHPYLISMRNTMGRTPMSSKAIGGWKVESKQLQSVLRTSHLDLDGGRVLDEF